MTKSFPSVIIVRRAASMLGLALIAALALFASEVWAQKPPVAEKPLNLTGQVVADGIQLNWEPPAARAAEVDGYQVYRRRPDAGEALLLVLVANTGSTATSYLDATATEPEVSYIYRVRAWRGTELSRMANKLQLTYTAPEPLIATQPQATQPQATQPQATPSELAPSNLRAAISGDGVQLEWDAPAVDADSVTSHFVTRLWTNAQAETCGCCSTAARPHSVTSTRRPIWRALCTRTWSSSRAAPCTARTRTGSP